jgi:penicillin-binding protein-related factor A (putative recombinase)
MIVKFLRYLIKINNIHALISRDGDKSIVVEWWRKRGDKISIDFYPLWQVNKFVLYRKLSSSNSLYKYTEIELPWIMIYYMDFYE